MNKIIKIGIIGSAITGFCFIVGVALLGMNTLSDSANRSDQAQAEIQFIDQAHQQGFTDSEQVTHHCFYHENNVKPNQTGLYSPARYFGNCPNAGEWID